jgi:acetyltransferase-like isoleucine patch superfamily enzyme
MGPNVQIYAATHPIEVEPRRAGLELGYPITVFSPSQVFG